MARDLLPQGTFGIPLYNGLALKRRADGRIWKAEDLAGALAELGVEISAKQIRAWIRGENYPRVDVFMAIAEVLGLDCTQLWPTQTKRVAGAADAGRHADDLAHRVAQGKRQLPAARPPKPGKPGHRRSG